MLGWRARAGRRERVYTEGTEDTGSTGSEKKGKGGAEEIGAGIWLSGLGLGGGRS